MCRRWTVPLIEGTEGCRRPWASEFVQVFVSRLSARPLPSASSRHSNNDHDVTLSIDSVRQATRAKYSSTPTNMHTKQHFRQHSDYIGFSKFICITSTSPFPSKCHQNKPLTGLHHFYKLGKQFGLDPVPLKCFDEQECYEVILVAAKKVKQAIRNRNTFSGCRIKCIYA